MKDFRDYLWDVLPEAREHILYEEMTEVASTGDVPPLAVYRHLSNAFFWPVLSGAVERGDTALVRRCLAVLEGMLTSEDEVLVEAVIIRVIAKAGNISGLEELLRRYAGPETRRRMAIQRQDDSWREPGVPAEPHQPVDDGRPPAEAWAVRGRLWDRTPVTREHLLRAELAEVRATGSLRAMTADRYVAEAVVRGLLIEASETTAERGDASFVEEAAAALELMLAHPELARLVRGHAAEIAAHAVHDPFLRAHAGPLLGELLAG